MDWPYLTGIFGGLPENFRAKIGESYKVRYEKEGQREANSWIREEIAENITDRRAILAASDAEVCAYAARRAECVMDMLGREMGCPADVMKKKLETYASRHGCSLPKDVELGGMVARMVDGGWWRRQIRRVVGRSIEAAAINLGMVHKFAGLYASEEAVSRYRQQQERNRKALECSEAVKVVEGREESFNLGDLVDLGVSNPSVRFAELMVRVRGMEAHAVEAGHIGLFCTGTVPSHMHPRNSGDGSKNDVFDGETVPRIAQQWMSRQWSRVRSALARSGVAYYGVRVAEPHHDGTPHWHMLVFMDGQYADKFMETLKKQLIRGDWKPSKKKNLVAQLRAQGMTCKAASAAADRVLEFELMEQERREQEDTARQKRACDFKKIDWSKGGAAGYLVKYLAKNISGDRVGADGEAANPEVGPQKPASLTAGRVRAWASVWGIRQFQVIGGPPVGVWRELRKVKDRPEQLELFGAWEATGSKKEDRRPDWCKFIREMGGIDCRRDDRPVQLWKLEEPGRLTKYRDQAPARVGGVVCAGRVTRTRDAVWEIRRVGDGEKAKVFKQCAKAEGVQGAVKSGARVPKEIVTGFRARPKAAQPWTRVNNCTRPAPPGAWEGIAANIAAHTNLGRKDVVGEIFEQLRRLKSGKSTGSGTEGEKGVGSRAAARESDGRRLR